MHLLCEGAIQCQDQFMCPASMQDTSSLHLICPSKCHLNIILRSVGRNLRSIIMLCACSLHKMQIDYPI